MRVTFQQLAGTLRPILEARGFSREEAATVAGIFSESTFDGVFSHGINRFPRFIRDVDAGIVKPGNKPERVQRLPAMEQWDGRCGAGILNALQCTERAMELAEGPGIGCVGLRNTNHWMRGGTYGWLAAEKGFLFMGWTNTMPNMPPWGGERALLGNNPFVVAIPRREGHVVLDMAMSQYSYGKLEWYRKNGKELPEYGGFNSSGEPTRDPGAILESGRILPIGLWKGSAMSLVLDLAGAALTGGDTTERIGRKEAETGLSQVFLCAVLSRTGPASGWEKVMEDAIGFLHSDRSAAYPGEGTVRRRRENMKSGVEIPDGMWLEITRL